MLDNFFRHEKSQCDREVVLQRDVGNIINRIYEYRETCMEYKTYNNIDINNQKVTVEMYWKIMKDDVLEKLTEKQIESKQTR